ncbi:tRNA(fMet)-specific endonuclease VapC [Pedobacter cryoconitis]|uniref:tRNA(fMet)-specific endonuclease VapC n=1 Tax=Pedobacter cryoconitis TaxID=188932 RepID=A0A7W9DL94_9SPHI|nr:type II toxin-antitoxin system VapC family toxin [Pedobacter cryoconitis]MBB5621925.1 tRNA(fMet)-specific endonuclease VapC [Pedobacter cryoconitis]
MQYLLDTSTCVFYLRGKLDLASIIREKGRKNFFISEITVVDDFVNGLSIIPIIGSIKRYAKEKVRLRKMGKPINDEFDLLIGVTSVENNLVLVTDNVKDFERIEDIQIENWYQR